MKVMILGAPSDIHCIRWANELSRKQIDVSICYVPNHVARLDELDEKVKLHVLKIKAPMGYCLNKNQLVKIINLEKPDIIHVHYASGYGTLGRLANKKSIPTLLSVYGSDIYEFPFKNNTNRKIMEKNLHYYDYIGSTSYAMAKKIIEINSDLKIDDIFITPFGVDSKLFVEKQQIRLKKENDSKIIVGSVKKLAPKYGIEYGIEAIYQILKERENLTSLIEYHIYGEGPQEEELKRLVENRNLQDNVKFFDRVKNTEVPKILESFDIFLAPSISDSESFGVSVVEAMSVGVPIIASDVDGFKEVLNNGECGLIFLRKSVKDLSSKLLYLIDNPEKSKFLVTNAKKRVDKLYVWDNNVQFMIEIYKLMIGRKKL